MSASNSASLLHEIFDLGEAIHAALTEEDIGRLFQLVEEHAALVRAINEHDHPSDIHSDWEEVAAGLARQRARISHAVAELESRYADQFKQLSHRQRAHESYENKSSRPNIIRRSVQG